MAEDKVSRKTQIMQTLARMLEEKEPVKITTAELARRTEITEAAIYRPVSYTHLTLPTNA